MEIDGYEMAQRLQILGTMQAQTNNETTIATKRALLCRMRQLLSAGSPTTWEQQELRTIEVALKRMDASHPEPCQRCGKRFHV